MDGTNVLGDTQTDVHFCPAMVVLQTMLTVGDEVVDLASSVKAITHLPGVVAVSFGPHIMYVNVCLETGDCKVHWPKWLVRE